MEWLIFLIVTEKQDEIYYQINICLPFHHISNVLYIEQYFKIIFKEHLTVYSNNIERVARNLATFNSVRMLNANALQSSKFRQYIDKVF